MDQVVLRNVRKDFTTKLLGTVTAVDNFNLNVAEGECFSFLGPSGCGKTTTLRMIAGFEDLSDGEIELCGRTVSNKAKNLYIPPEKRDLGMVFQAFSSFYNRWLLLLRPWYRANLPRGRLNYTLCRLGSNLRRGP